jgi:hypothetical protein
LTQKVRQYSRGGRLLWPSSLPRKLVKNADHEHRLSLARIPFYPEQSALSVMEPFFEFGVIKDPAKRISQQAAFGLLDAYSIVTGIGQQEVG